MKNLQIIGEYDTELVEGKSFKMPFKIRALDENGNPVKNQLITAMIHEHRGVSNKYGYFHRDIGWENKDLEYPFPAKYSANSFDPLTNDDIIFDPILTDDNGTVTFSDLKFSVNGPAGIQN